MKIETVNVRISKEIVNWLDSLIENGVYNSRSEAIRDFVRSHINNRGKSDE